VHQSEKASPVKPHGLWTPGFWRAYLLTMRPYLLFVSGAAGMAGFADGSSRSVSATLVVFFALFLSYGFGQALTDCFQIDTDSLSSPYRPLVRGSITKRQVLWTSLIGLFSCCLILLVHNPKILVPGVLCVFGLATYTFFKRRWWGGPFYNAWIVALLPIIGKMAAVGYGWSFGSVMASGILLPITISTLFSYANFVLMGYFKDISADRASGYNTFCVAFGWKRAAVATDLLALLSILATGWAFWKFSSFASLLCPIRLPSVGIFIVAIIGLILAQLGIHRTRDEHKAHDPIANVVRGFVLLRLAEICLVRPGWLILVAIFYIGFEAVLKLRPEESQI